MLQMGGYKKFGYFKWWVISNENWMKSDKWLFLENQTVP